MPALLRAPHIRVLFKLLGADTVRPTYSEAAAFKAFENHCDPVADDFVAAMRRAGGNVGRVQLEQALEHGIDSVDNPLPELVAFIEALAVVPDWVDYEKLDRAGQAMARLPLHMIFMLTVSLGFPLSYISSRINEVLACGDLDKRAGARVAETIGWIVHCSSLGGMQRFGEGFKATARVRIVHAYIRAGVRSKGWDADVLGEPINQLHQMITLVPLLGIILVGQLLGIRLDSGERKAIIHLFRYMAHVTGVVPELQVSSLKDLLKVTWIGAHLEFDLDVSPQNLTASMLRASPQLFGISGDGVRGRLARWACIRFHSDLLRLALGGRAADQFGLTPLSPMIALLPGIVALNILSELVRTLIPGESSRAASRGDAKRRRVLAELSVKLATRPYERDDAAPATHLGTKGRR